MKLEKQVPNLELCKRLKELGYPQEDSLWYWFAKFFELQLHTAEKVIEWELISGLSPLIKTYTDKDRIFAAPTVAEMGEILPYKFNYKIGVSRCFYWIKMRKMDTQFSVAYSADSPKSIGIEEVEKTEADARAQMLIYLLENKLIEL